MENSLVLHIVPCGCVDLMPLSTSHCQGPASAGRLIASGVLLRQQLLKDIFVCAFYAHLCHVCHVIKKNLRTDRFVTFFFFYRYSWITNQSIRVVEQGNYHVIVVNECSCVQDPMISMLFIPYRISEYLLS